MCDPVSIAVAGAAANAGGSFLNAQGEAGNAKAAVNASNAENIALQAKEAAHQKDATNIFDQTLQPFQGNVPGQNLATAQGGNTATFNANGPSAAQLAGGATSGNAPRVVQDAENSSIASRMQTLGENNARLGALTGYDTQNQDSGRALHSAGDQIGTIGNFAQQDATVGAKLRAAAIKNSQKAISPFGDILKGVGTAAALGSGLGWFNPAATSGVITAGGASAANGSAFAGGGFTPNIGGTGFIY